MLNMKDEFTFKQFSIRQDRCGMKVGTDGVLIGAFAGQTLWDKREAPLRILDIGTGTGLIALMLAQRFPNAQVDALDIDADACAQAGENVAASPFLKRVKIFEESLQEFSMGAERELGNYDLIVSNPPFFVNSLKNPDTKRSRARHTDTLPFLELVRCSKLLLSDAGILSVILPSDVSKDFASECALAGLFPARQCNVKTVERKQPKRVLLEYQKCRPEQVKITTEVMMDSEGNRSEWYVKLTDEFYL